MKIYFYSRYITVVGLYYGYKYIIIILPLCLQLYSASEDMFIVADYRVVFKDPVDDVKSHEIECYLHGNNGVKLINNVEHWTPQNIGKHYDIC